MYSFLRFSVYVTCALFLVSGVTQAANKLLNSAQIELDTINVPIISWLASRPHASPNSLTDLSFAPESHERLANTIELALSGKWADAMRIARRFGYELVLIVDEDKSYLAIQEKKASGISPTIVISFDYERNVIAEAPHARFEQGTAEQAGALLKYAGIRAAIISGAHRCATLTFGQCRGTTTVCGDRRGSPYRKSDVAHNPGTIFHNAHLTLTKAWPKSIVISLHGMRARSGSNVRVILSDGSKHKYVAPESILQKLRDDYRRRINVKPNVIVSCNNIDDQQYKFPKLCGYTNIQGISLNGGSAQCGLSTSTSTRRFIHIEQTWEILGEFNRQWATIEKTGYAYPLIQSLKLAIPGSP